MNLKLENNQNPVINHCFDQGLKNLPPFGFDSEVVKKSVFIQERSIRGANTHTHTEGVRE